MTPINGVLRGLGIATLEETTDIVIPSNATHFSFGFSGTGNKNRTHGHISLAGKNCILKAGELYALHTHSYKPTIRKTSVSDDTFTEISFYRIDTRP